MNVNYNATKTRLRTVKSTDPEFTIVDGMVVAKRAGFEISQQCPYEYLMVIDECLRNGWLKPVATVYEHELVWNYLKDQ